MKKLSNLVRLSLMTFVLVGLNSCSSDDETPVVQSKPTIAALATASPQFSTLVDALNITGLTATFDSAGSYTVFAPTNAAFSTFLSANGYADINAVPVPALTEILKNHVVSGTNLASSLATSYVKTLAKGAASPSNTLSMYIEVSGGTVTLNGVADVTAADITASNGVIHQVDAVIGLPTIVTHATANSDFTSLVAGLTRADQPDFVGILSGTANSPFTVFAPTNMAFSDLLTELSYASLNDIPQATLESTLKYHVVTNTNTLSSDITPPATLTTFQGQNFTINSTGGGLKITDANARISSIIATDVQCANGVIHVINKVLLPL